MKSTTLGCCPCGEVPFPSLSVKQRVSCTRMIALVRNKNPKATGEFAVYIGGSGYYVDYIGNPKDIKNIPKKWEE